MMRKLIGLITLSLVMMTFCFPAFSAPVNQDLAVTVGEVFIQKELGSGVAVEGEWPTAFSSVQSQVAEVTALKNDADKIVAYVLEPASAGYVVVSADTQITPIIAYAYSGKFSFADVEGNLLLQMVKADMTLRLEALSEFSAEKKAANEALWDDLQWNTAPSERSRWGPWLRTKWHEKNPFWQYCPLDPDTQGRVHVGSGATAMAQIMFYHRWPRRIRLSPSDRYRTKTKRILINYFNHDKAGYLSFKEMNKELRNILWGPPYYIKTKAAVSFACGIMVKMDYAAGESKSARALQDYPWVLKRKFRFLEAKYLHRRHSNLYPMARENMKNKLPGILEIRKRGTTITRKVVVDGYKTTGHYHLNYGEGRWGIIGWYHLPDGMPGGYKIVAGAVLDIIPRQ